MKVSVITPSFNSIKTIERCIDSIKNQDHPDIEHIVIDNNSNDGTIDVLKKHDIFYVSEADFGLYHAMNKGIKLASGEIIHILNSDDWYSEKDIISKVVKTMELENCDFCHGYVDMVNHNNEVIWRIGKSVTKKELFKKMQVAHGSCFVRSSIYQRFGDFGTSFRIAADYDFILRVWSKIEIVFIPQVLVNMQLGGISNARPFMTYKEFMAVAIIHGKNIIPALLNLCFEYLKHHVITFIRKHRGISKNH